STRPARRRPVVSTSDSAGTGDERGAARRAPGGLTGRAAVLGLVVCALVLSLAYPAKEFLAQRGEISRLQDEQRQAQARVSALEERKRQLADPAYVQAQVRARLHYVMPGETLYVVVPPSGSGADGGAEPTTPEVSDDGSWYGRLWGTVRTADGSAP
ncbi:MAG TPA: septum formation initiator family protein, partial [Mycobacteriales bacterium]|nr:septum formation initiator family protein [Mycobacteriales bacterium]